MKSAHKELRSTDWEQIQRYKKEYERLAYSHSSQHFSRKDADAQYQMLNSDQTNF